MKAGKHDRSSLSNSFERKAADLVQKLDESIQRIMEAFEICPEIKKVVVSFGATSASPKEMYTIHMPPLNPDAENLPGKACLKTLFRQLLAEDPLRDIKQISPSNITIFLLAPRHSGLNWFFPKPNYHIPTRGHKVEFYLFSKCGQGSHDLSKDFSIIELSGFEPFDTTYDGSLTALAQLGHHSSEESVTADYVCVNSAENLDESSVAVFDFNTSCNPLSDSEHVKTDDVSDSVTLNNFKRLKKSSSASSILSQASVMAKSEGTSSCHEEFEFEYLDPEFIWFQSPLIMKGYKIHTKS